MYLGLSPLVSASPSQRMLLDNMGESRVYGRAAVFVSISNDLLHLRSWDPLVLDCWYSNANQKERLAWQVSHSNLNDIGNPLKQR